jgi:hypothetical protein
VTTTKANVDLQARRNDARRAKDFMTWIERFLGALLSKTAVGFVVGLMECQSCGDSIVHLLIKSSPHRNLSFRSRK